MGSHVTDCKQTPLPFSANSGPLFEVSATVGGGAKWVLLIGTREAHVGEYTLGISPGDCNLINSFYIHTCIVVHI